MSALALRALQHCASLACAAPDFPGRATIVSRMRNAARGYDVDVSDVFGDGLRFEGNPSHDANVLELMLLRYAKPALAPVLDAALSPGGLFVDVGANLGMYTLWAAQRVGPTGAVRAFEPIPATRERLTRNVALNGFDQVRIEPRGLGAEPGQITLYCVEGVSGLTSRYLSSQAVPVEIEVTTLDAEFEPSHAPQLIKIDVEGMELEVLRGARALLAAPEPPLVVFEANTQHFSGAGTTYRELLTYLEEVGGLEPYVLGRKGLRPEAPDAEVPSSADILAARADAPAHRAVLDRLARVGFRDEEMAPHTRLLAALRGGG